MTKQIMSDVTSSELDSFRNLVWCHSQIGLNSTLCLITQQRLTHNGHFTPKVLALFTAFLEDKNSDYGDAGLFYRACVYHISKHRPDEVWMDMIRDVNTQYALEIDLPKSQFEPYVGKNDIWKTDISYWFINLV